MTRRDLGLVALGLLCGCSPAGPTIGQAGPITLYEGLPHPMYEAKTLAEEKASKPTIDLHGFSFYRQTIALKPSDETALKTILADPGTYKADSGEKKCGGYHPDFEVEWSASGQEHSDEICFGCGEIRRHGPSGESRFDLTAGASKRLAALLKPLRRSRPDWSNSGP